ncbi:hypothetical protein [Streptomyces chryseus]|uniref:hypothetical protein n=1 Tax=Streptomyces chryseus TaxID=68186 RepID=UPI00110F747C|nr:hypothetical protein [Streptomyces chryseus]GGX23428.1 hypothetical protein GCM10010353_43080 [Streptomyces chryseus]
MLGRTASSRRFLTGLQHRWPGTLSADLARVWLAAEEVELRLDRTEAERADRRRTGPADVLGPDARPDGRED